MGYVDEMRERRAKEYEARQKAAPKAPKRRLKRRHAVPSVATADEGAPGVETAAPITTGEEMGVNENPSQVHGRLNEALRIGGYALKRAFEQLEWLLEEDRWRQVGNGYADVHTFLSTVQLPPGAPPDQRAAIAQRIKELQPEASQRAIAGVLGVSQPTVGQDLERSLSPDGANAAELLESGEPGERNLSLDESGPPPARRQHDPRAKHLRAALREIRQARKLCEKGQIASRLRGTESVIRTIVSELEV